MENNKTYISDLGNIDDEDKKDTNDKETTRILGNR